MAIGIYTSLYVLNKLKDKIPPRVDFVSFEDGLLLVRCNRPLTPKDTIVKLRATFGTIMAQVEVQSYDERSKVYRLAIQDHELLLAQLEDERRDSMRLPRMLHARSSVFGEEQALTEDISETGARILTPDPLEPGTLLRLELQLGDWRLDTEAEVRWSASKMDGSSHCGVHFLALTEGQKYNIRCYVEHHLEKEKELKKLKPKSRPPSEPKETP